MPEEIILCPNCGVDLTASTDNDGDPIWVCRECGYGDRVMKDTLPSWRNARDRGGFQR